MADPGLTKDMLLGTNRESGDDEGVPAFLQLTDKLTDRRCAILLESGDLELTIDETLELLKRNVNPRLALEQLMLRLPRPGL